MLDMMPCGIYDVERVVNAVSHRILLSYSLSVSSILISPISAILLSDSRNLTGVFIFIGYLKVINLQKDFNNLFSPHHQPHPSWLQGRFEFLIKNLIINKKSSQNIGRIKNHSETTFENSKNSQSSLKRELSKVNPLWFHKMEIFYILSKKKYRLNLKIMDKI